MNAIHKPTLLAIVLAVLFTFTLTGCNTMNGVGKDVERAGESIQRNAK